MSLKRHIAYAKVVFRHKWCVMKGCRIMGVPLWRGIIHDWTKFLPIEWFPYARHFYNEDGSKREVRNPDGSYDPNLQEIEFRRSWLHHQRSKHHWQAWVVLGDGGSLSPLPIPEVYLREKISDWIGAGLAYSNEPNPYAWYSANVGKMVMHEESRRRLSELMEQFKKEK